MNGYRKMEEWIYMHQKNHQIMHFKIKRYATKYELKIYKNASSMRNKIGVILRKMILIGNISCRIVSFITHRKVVARDFKIRNIQKNVIAHVFVAENENT